VIYVTHGIAPHWSSARISHALLVPEPWFVMHLQQRSSKYVSLARALAGEGDALTIDDATFGAFWAAMLAQSQGHEVSWFVNGIHVDCSLTYFPFQLSCMIDAVLREECVFDGQTWDLRGRSGRRTLRLYLKQRYMRMGRQESVAHLLQSVARSLDVDLNCMEDSLRTVTSAELTAAVAAGIELQNHGWSHLNPLLLSADEYETDAALNEDYLSQFRKAATRAYAPPFGRYVGRPLRAREAILLADRNLVPGRQKPNVFNRVDLQLNASSPQVEAEPAATQAVGVL
jgi:hypothetical protein